MPISILRALASIIGKDAAVDRLCESLQVDISKNKTILGWMPPYTLEQGILEMVKP